MDLEGRNLLIELFDIYSPLLTDKQKAYFEDYYYADLSLSEIASNYDVSRNAVHDMLKKTEEILIKYEDALKIHQRNEKIKKVLKDNEALDDVIKILEE